jgi:hypothetical protein
VDSVIVQKLGQNQPINRMQRRKATLREMAAHYRITLRESTVEVWRWWEKKYLFLKLTNIYFKKINITKKITF